MPMSKKTVRLILGFNFLKIQVHILEFCPRFLAWEGNSMYTPGTAIALLQPAEGCAAVLMKHSS